MSLPVVDFSGADRSLQADKVVSIMEKVGFLLLDNVPGYDEDEPKWCVEFFYDEMPVEKKLEMARISYNPHCKQVDIPQLFFQDKLANS